MQHQHPLFRDLKSDLMFITIGEIMLRLSPPNYQKIRMANEFEATYGGSEANIALSLANPGIDSTFFTVVPNNSIGKSAIRTLAPTTSTAPPSSSPPPRRRPPTVWAPTIWRRATASVPPRSPTTASTPPSPSMT